MYVVFPFPIFLSLFDRLGHGSSHHDMGLNKAHGDGWGEGRGQGAGLTGEEGAALEVVGSHMGEGAAAGTSLITEVLAEWQGHLPGVGYLEGSVSAHRQGFQQQTPVC